MNDKLKGEGRKEGEPRKEMEQGRQGEWALPRTNLTVKFELLSSIIYSISYSILIEFDSIWNHILI